jgi:hypothetical protein
MRESRTYGSVRGAQGNLRPYRDQAGLCELFQWVEVSHCLSRAKRRADLAGIAHAGRDGTLEQERVALGEPAHAPISRACSNTRG